MLETICFNEMCINLKTIACFFMIKCKRLSILWLQLDVEMVEFKDEKNETKSLKYRKCE